MGLKVTIRMPEDIIDNKISKLENDIAKAKKAGKNTEAMEKRLKVLDAKKQSMMDTAGDKGEELLLPKEAPIPKPKPKPRPLQNSKGGGVKKPAMAYGGMANKKKHMYTAGGSVKDYRPMQPLKKKY